MTQTHHLTSYLDAAGHNPQVAVVSGGVESLLTSPSPTGLIFHCFCSFNDIDRVVWVAVLVYCFFLFLLIGKLV